MAHPAQAAVSQTDGHYIYMRNNNNSHSAVTAAASSHHANATMTTSQQQYGAANATTMTHIESSAAVDLHGPVGAHGGHGKHGPTMPPTTTPTPRDFSQAIAAVAAGNLPVIRLATETVLYGILSVMLAQACIILLFDAYVLLFFGTRAARQRHWYHHTSVRQMLFGNVVTALSAIVSVVFDICRLIALADDDVVHCDNDNNSSPTTFANKSLTTIGNLSLADCEHDAPPPTFPSWFFKTLFYILRCCQLALFMLIACCAYHQYQLYTYSAHGRHSERGHAMVAQALSGGTAEPTSYDCERVFSRRNLSLKQLLPGGYAIGAGVLVVVVMQIERSALGVTGELDNLWAFVTTTPRVHVPGHLLSETDDKKIIENHPPELIFVWYLYTLLFYVVPLVLAIIVDRLLFRHQVHAEMRMHDILTAPTAIVPTDAAAAAGGKAPPQPPKKGERPEDKLREHIYDVSSTRRQHAAAFLLAWLVPVVHDALNHFQHADQKLDIVANIEWAWNDELPNLVLLCISQYMFLCFAIFSLQFVHGLPVEIPAGGAKKNQ